MVLVAHRRRLATPRETMDAGTNASVLPVMNTASMVGFGAVIATLPAFAGIRDALVAIPGGPLVSVAVATNVIAGITGSASGGLITMGETYVRMAAAAGIDPALMHRVVAIGCGGLSGLPHNGAVVTLLSVCGATHRGSYRDIAIVTAKTYGIRVGTLRPISRRPTSARRWWHRRRASSPANSIAHSFRGVD